MRDREVARSNFFREQSLERPLNDYPSHNTSQLSALPPSNAISGASSKLSVLSFTQNQSILVTTSFEIPGDVGSDTPQ